MCELSRRFVFEFHVSVFDFENMCANAGFLVVVVRVVLFFFKPETRGLQTDSYRSILVHFLFTDWSVYLYTRSAVPLK